MRCLTSTLAMTLLVAGAATVRADDAAVLSSEQIQQALQPVATRGFQPRGLARRQASETEQSVNLAIPFELNSSTLKPQASAQLKELSIALNSEALRQKLFIIAGHTDAKGSAAYNKQLSLKRAQTVTSFLIANGMDPKRLGTLGLGSEQLLRPDRPDDPSNRRVEIRAMSLDAR